MKIVRIFEDRLFAFHYENELYNEFERCMNQWTDVSYLHAYAKANKLSEVRKFIENALHDAEEIQDFLDNLESNNEPYGFYFEPIQDSERTRILSLQKGKIRRNQLRYYAIKLEEACFVITGGAIKMSQKMQDHPDTSRELIKLQEARMFLHSKGVFDDDSFFELLSEES